MNRLFGLLSGASFLAILAMIALVFFGVINPINWLEYIVLLCSAFLTFLSLGIFIRGGEISKSLKLLIVILLIWPCLPPLLGIFKAEFITVYWKMFIGGSIFQMGTAIFTLLGGFLRKKDVGIYQILNTFNYILFLLLALTLVFNLTELLSRSLLLIVGGILSVLSLFLVFFRRKGVV